MPGEEEKKEPPASSSAGTGGGGGGGTGGGGASKKKKREPLFEEDSELMIISEESEGDLNFSWCGVCGKEGDLLCCEFCPCAFHIKCIGLDRVPRHQWKCYFCKVVMNGLESARPSPKEQPLCL